MEDYFLDRDTWFAENWQSKITQPFAVWWREYYGLPEDSDDVHEYFVRMAFAFMGWQAAQQNAQAALIPARHKLVSCPQCKLMFGVDLPVSQNG